MITFSVDNTGQKWRHVRRNDVVQVDIHGYRDSNDEYDIELYDMQCSDCGEPIGFVEGDGDRPARDVSFWAAPGANAVSRDVPKYCEDCLDYDAMDSDTPVELVTSASLLDVVDTLEDLATRVVPTGNGRAEPFVARRLLIDAAAAVRGAANQLHKMGN